MKGKPKLHCVFCGRELRGKRKKYCSKRCKDTDWRERKKRDAKPTPFKGEVYVLEGDRWKKEQRE